jgi:DNA-binding GntR family transcriptional regulator
VAKVTRDIGGEDNPLREQVRDELRDQINDGRLTPGERLVEQALADEFNVSRIPVREALRMLQTEGLVTTLPRRGAFVAQLNRSDLEHLYDVRAALEVLAFSRAAEHATPQHIKQLGRIVERTLAAANRHHHAEATRLNAEFHETVIAAAGNPYLSSTYGSLTGRLRWLVNQSREYERHVAEHAGLIEAIAARDPERAGALALAHIRTSRAHGLLQYDQSQAKGMATRRS